MLYLDESEVYLENPSEITHRIPQGELNKKLRKEAKVCPNCRAYFLINEYTGETVRLGCKTYKCSICGPKKALRLRKALRKYFGQFKFIRLGTFTFRSGIFDSLEEQLILVPKIWKYFITALRRCRQLTEAQRKVQYVKIFEFQKNGTIHYHVLWTQFLEWAIIQNLWLSAINTVTGKLGKNGHYNIIAMMNRKMAANYVTKYVVKSAKEVGEHIQANIHHKKIKTKLWTRSGKISIFEAQEKQEGWHFLKMPFSFERDFLNLYILETSSQTLGEDICKNNEIVLY